MESLLCLLCFKATFIEPLSSSRHYAKSLGKLFHNYHHKHVTKGLLFPFYKQKIWGLESFNLTNVAVAHKWQCLGFNLAMAGHKVTAIITTEWPWIFYSPPCFAGLSLTESPMCHWLAWEMLLLLLLLCCCLQLCCHWDPAVYAQGAGSWCAGG